MATWPDPVRILINEPLSGTFSSYVVVVKCGECRKFKLRTYSYEYKYQPDDNVCANGNISDAVLQEAPAPTSTEASIR